MKLLKICLVFSILVAGLLLSFVSMACGEREATCTIFAHVHTIFGGERIVCEDKGIVKVKTERKLLSCVPVKYSYRKCDEQVKGCQGKNMGKCYALLPYEFAAQCKSSPPPKPGNPKSK